MHALIRAGVRLGLRVKGFTKEQIDEKMTHLTDEVIDEHAVAAGIAKIGDGTVINWLVTHGPEIIKLIQMIISILAVACLLLCLTVLSGGKAEAGWLKDRVQQRRSGTCSSCTVSGQTTHTTACQFPQQMAGPGNTFVVPASNQSCPTGNCPAVRQPTTIFQPAPRR